MCLVVEVFNCVKHLCETRMLHAVYVVVPFLLKCRIHQAIVVLVNNICLINSKLVLIPPKEPCWCVYERLGDHQPSTDGHKDEWRELNTLDTLHTAPLLCLSVVRCQ